MSEVARLRRLIELEYEAGRRALNDPAIIAPHAYITARMENVQRSFEALKQLIPEEEALNILVAATEGSEHDGRD